MAEQHPKWVTHTGEEQRDKNNAKIECSSLFYSEISSSSSSPNEIKANQNKGALSCSWWWVEALVFIYERGSRLGVET